MQLISTNGSRLWGIPKHDQPLGGFRLNRFPTVLREIGATYSLMPQFGCAIEVRLESDGADASHDHDVATDGEVALKTSRQNNARLMTSKKWR